MLRATLCLLVLVERATSSATTFYVDSLLGDDSNSGESPDLAFQTIFKCAKAITKEADNEDCTCIIAPGVYREEVPVPEAASRRSGSTSFIGSGSGTEVCGLDVLDLLDWELWQQTDTSESCIFRAAVPETTFEFQQLFFRGDMMVEARWPNVDVAALSDQMLSVDRKAWEPTNVGSRYGIVVDSSLSKFDFSWNGALATLNVAHQFYTWTRKVSNHTPGGSSFTYPQDLPGITSYANETTPWESNQYFLSGLLQALDSPGEWFLDTTDQILYFWPVDCQPPTAGDIEIKTRSFAFDSYSLSENVHFSGMTLRGSTIRMRGCNSCSATNLDLLYPTYNREVLESDANSSKTNETLLNGTGILVTNMTLSFTNNHGLQVTGEDIIVDNVLVHSTDWLGTLKYMPLGVEGNHINVTRSTVRDFGNAGIVTKIPNTPASQPDPVPQPMAERWLDVSFTHVFNGGLVGKDTSGMYTLGWDSAGVIWHHNWVHDMTEKCMRADDQSRNISVYNNVAFNCGLAPIEDVKSGNTGIALIIKGDGHVLFANTLFSTNYTELCMPACEEPEKDWEAQYPLSDAQNANTDIFNTAALHDYGYPCSCSNKTAHLNNPGGNTSGVYHGDLEDLSLVDPANFDFRPAADSPLVDAGVVFPPYTNGFTGNAPDIGAYEFEGEQWAAGCSMPGCSIEELRQPGWKQTHE
mmetsp:Transcript_28422/g.58153  ORF Transcript_28422/g.58153 Transcript_28422/m.58153 type:complete len:694 (-) Transcript_28422:285-2366(-)